MTSCSSCKNFPRRADHHDALYAESIYLSRLRTSNLAATDEEIAQVQTIFLLPVLHDIEVIDTSIDALYETLHLMRKERRKLVRIRKRFNALVSPRRNVPLEIWSEIFVHANLNSLPDDISIAPMRYVPAVQWTLGQVCRTWRTAILSTHELWSKVFISFPTDLTMPRVEERLEVLLRRSGYRPLHLRIFERDVRDPVVENEAAANARRDKLMEILFSESYRWKSVYLSRFDDFSFHRLQGRLPLLETLSIHFRCNDEQPEECPTVSGFFLCPRLSNVTISGDEKDIELPWAQIRTLNVAIYEDDSRRIGLYRCLRLAEKCHNLERLTVDSNMMEYFPDETDPDYMLTSHSIRKVDIIYEFILDHLILPQLQSATLSKLRWYGDPTNVIQRVEILSSFYHLLRRSDCTSLTKLEIVDLSSNGDGEFTLDILTWTRSLTTLKLHVLMKIAEGDERVPDIVGMGELCKIIERLSPRHERTLLPCIQDLDIRIHDHPQSAHPLYFGKDDGTFVNMLRARWRNDPFEAPGTSKLRRFHFNLEADHISDTETREPGSALSSRGLLTVEERLVLHKLCEEGMDLSILVTSELTSRWQQYVVLQIPPPPVPEDLWSRSSY